MNCVSYVHGMFTLDFFTNILLFCIIISILAIRTCQGNTEREAFVMDHISVIAFNATKEIVIAKVGSSTISPNEESGKAIADMFEAIYSRLLKIAKEAEVR